MCLRASLHLKVTGADPKLDPDPLVRGADPHQDVTDPQHWFYDQLRQFLISSYQIFKKFGMICQEISKYKISKLSIVCVTQDWGNLVFVICCIEFNENLI